MVVGSIPRGRRTIGRLVLGWVTVACIPRRYVSSHPGQLSLLPSVGLEMSTGQNAVMRCGWGVKAGRLIPFVDKRVGAGKVVRSLVNTCHSERFRGDFSRRDAIQMSCLQLKFLLPHPGCQCCDFVHESCSKCAIYCESPRKKIPG